MSGNPKLLDCVAITRPMKSDDGVALVAGQAGTIVEEFPNHDFLIEFSDTSGQTYAMATVNTNDLLVLHHQSVDQAETASERQEAGQT